MRAYLYFTWEDVEDENGFAMLKQAMLHDVSDHIYQLGYKGFLFLTKKSYQRVEEAIKEKRGRAFILVDITDGLSSDKFKTNINVDELRKRFRSESSVPLCADSILDKILTHGGYASLTQEERDYLDANSASNETEGG